MRITTDQPSDTRLEAIAHRSPGDLSWRRRLTTDFQVIHPAARLNRMPGNLSLQASKTDFQVICEAHGFFALGCQAIYREDAGTDRMPGNLCRAGSAPGRGVGCRLSPRPTGTAGGSYGGIGALGRLYAAAAAFRSRRIRLRTADSGTRNPRSPGNGERGRGFGRLLGESRSPGEGGLSGRGRVAGRAGCRTWA